MSSSGSPRAGSEDFSEAESDIPSLACNAAIELHGLLLGEQQKFLSVRSLADRISSSLLPSSSAKSNQGGRSHLYPKDPTVRVVVRQAIADTHFPSKPPESVEELLSQAEDIIGRLRKALVYTEDEPSLNDSELSDMITFCLALSKKALAYEQYLYDPRPRRPGQ